MIKEIEALLSNWVEMNHIEVKPEAIHDLAIIIAYTYSWRPKK